MSNDESVLVTGGAGFLGYAVITKLLSKGFDVISVDLPGTSERFLSLPEHSNLSRIECNILDGTLAEHLPPRLDYVIHLAGLSNVRESFRSPKKYDCVNVDGTIHLIEHCRDRSVKRFMFASSAAVYGSQNEDAIEPSHPLNPLSPYGVSKMSAEQYVGILGREYGIDTLVLRFFNLYGPNQPVNQGGIIPIFVKSAIEGTNIEIYGSGDRTRSFVHVDDAANALVLGCSSNQIPVDTLNICANEPITITELASMIIRLSGNESVKIEYVETDQALALHSHCKPGHTKQALDYSPSVCLEDGIREIVDSYK